MDEADGLRARRESASRRLLALADFGYIGSAQA